jgi:c-di-GMP-binding flagellar brake protein YcgR
MGTVYNESSTTITATLKNCDVENTTVKATSYDFCTTGMVAFVYEGNNDKIEFENCTVKDVKLYAKPNGYASHAAIYVNDAETDDCFNEAAGVTVTNVTFEAIN